MTRIRIELECNDDAAKFFNELMEDARDLVKGDEDKLEQYESAVYEIKERPQLYPDQLEKILDSDASFASHIYEVGNNLDGATVDLIAAAYDLDGDDMSDEDFLNTVKEILALRAHHKSATELDPALNCECGYQH
jgi:hypothetical protein